MFSQLRKLNSDARLLVLPKPVLPTTVSVNSAAYEHLENVSYKWDGARRRIPFALVQHTISGCGHLRFEGQRIKLDAGTTMLLQFPHDNSYWLEEGGSWEFFWMALSGEEVLALWKRLILTRGPVHYLPVEVGQQLGDKLIDILGMQVIHAARLTREATEICSLLSTALTGHMPGDMATHAPRLEEDLRLAVDLMLDYKGKQLPISDIARSLGYSRHYFSRAFKRQYGMSPVEYRDAQRMAHAQALLLQTDSKIKLVADACGFEDPNYFAKAFKKRFGIAPLAYRSRNGGH